MVYAAALAVTPEFDFQGIPKVRFTDLLLPVILVVTLAQRPEAHRGGPRPWPLLLPMVLILLWDLCALMALGQAPLTPGIFYLGKRGAYFVILAFGVRVGRTSSKALSAIPKALVFTSPLLALSVQLEQTLHANDPDFRASGIIHNQEQSTAYFLVLVIALVLGLWPVWTRPHERLGLSIALAAGVKTLFATGTRGGIVLLVVVGALLLPRARKASGLLILLLALTCSMAWVLAPEGIKERLSQVNQESQTVWVGVTEGVDQVANKTGESSTAGRLVAAQDVLNLFIAQSPLWGYGAGYKRLGYDDDMYVTEWMYHGLIGLSLWLWFQLALGYLLWRARQNLQDPQERALAAAMTVVWVAFSVGGFVADIFYLIRPCEGFFLLAGLVAGRVPLEAPRRTRVISMQSL